MAGPFDVARRSPWPRLRPQVVAVVFAGGCVGGLARYGATNEWPASTHRFPWSTFAVNIAGAFILAVLVRLAGEVLGPSRYVRPLIGTGFCGALTTFSSVVVAVDQLVAHGHAATAAAYLVATIAAGLAAGAVGLAAGRTFGAYRRRAREAGEL